VLGCIYTLIEEDRESPLRDAREFATLLNACGRLGKASLGIGTCLNDDKLKKRALTHMLKYKREIVTSLDWYNKNKDSKDIHSEDGILIINAKDNIMPTMIGTVASIISKSNEIKDNTFVLSLAREVDGTTKVSLRIAGQRPRKDIDLRSLITEIVGSVGGESGGHHQAAGALIDSKKENEFISAAKEVLRRKVMEEMVK
jgi:single-stranded-DNA-specific exonuclease